MCGATLLVGRWVWNLVIRYAVFPLFETSSFKLIFYRLRRLKLQCECRQIPAFLHRPISPPLFTIAAIPFRDFALQKHCTPFSLAFTAVCLIRLKIGEQCQAPFPRFNGMAYWHVDAACANCGLYTLPWPIHMAALPLIRRLPPHNITSSTPHFFKAPGTAATAHCLGLNCRRKQQCIFPLGCGAWNCQLTPG